MLSSGEHVEPVPVLAMPDVVGLDVLSAALRYAESGFYVGPLVRDTKDPGSVLGTGWQHQTSRDPHQLAAWFTGIDHDVFIHVGRSGAVVFDVDHPELLHEDLARAIKECEPPYQSSRPDVPGRGHYLFLQPPDRNIGNGCGTLGKRTWGEVRGRNGVVRAVPSHHTAGHYRWARIGVVPMLPDYLGAHLPDAGPGTPQVLNGELRDWLDEHGNGEMCGELAAAVERARRDIRPHHRHDLMRDATTSVSHLIREGHTGGMVAIAELRTINNNTTTVTETEANDDFMTELRGAVAKMIGQPVNACDPCTLGGVFGSPYAAPAVPVAEPECDAAPPGEDVRAQFPRIDWEALWADDSVDEWIIEPILPARRLVAIYSAPKVGKSLLMLELAAAVATGRPVLGCTPDRPRRTLYVDFENDPKSDVRERLKAMGYGPADLDRLDYLSFPSLSALDGAQGGDELMRAVAAYGSEVVVIDTVSRAVSGKENENDTWLAFYRHTGLHLKRAGVALVRLDHAGKDEAKGQRGGSAKEGDVDAVWRLSEVVHGETYRLHCTHHRMPVAEPLLTLHRVRVPYLHHVVDPRGRVAAFDARVEHLADLADAHNLPHDAGRDALKVLAKSLGQGAGTDVLAKAIALRKHRLVSVLNGSGQVSDVKIVSAVLDGSGQGGQEDVSSP